MKKLYIICAICLTSFMTTQAQNVVTVDASASWIGFANVFETDANGGAFVFNSGWGIPDLKSVIDAGTNTVTVQPNFNTWGDGTDPFWVDQTTGEGNKVFEANTFIEDNTLAGTELFFRGTVDSNTIDGAYEAVAFIKVFNADFSVLKEETQPMVAGEVFTVQYTNVEAADAIVQYGFKVTGVVADPATEAALGSVVIGDASLGVDDFAASNVTVFPNPSSDQWILNSATATIESVSVFNILGQKVIETQAIGNSITIDAANLNSGMYIATIETVAGTSSIKLIKD